MLKHYYSEDYLLHLAQFTNCEIKSFVVEGLAINFFVKTGSFGEVINSSPFYGSHGGFYSYDDTLPIPYETVSAAELTDWLTRNEVSSITIIENPYCSAEESSKNFELIDLLKSKRFLKYEKINRLSFLKHTENIYDTAELLESYHSKTRNCVRKYLKSGSRIRVFDQQSAQFESTLEWLAIQHKIGIEAKKGKAKPLTYFRGLKNNYEKERFEVKIAYLGNKPIGGLLNFKINNQTEYWTPVTTELGKTVNAIYGLINHTLQDIIGKKGSFLNFGGSWESQHDLKRFKQRFGSIICHYNYHCFVLNDIIYQKSPAELIENYPYFFVREY